MWFKCKNLVEAARSAASEVYGNLLDDIHISHEHEQNDSLTFYHLSFNVLTFYTTKTPSECRFPLGNKSLIDGNVSKQKIFGMK